MNEKSFQSIPSFSELTELYGPVKIFVVDDDEKTIKMIGSLFQPYKWAQIVACISGQDALKRVLTARPAIILLDLNMPVMNGMETLKKLKDMGVLNFSTVIFLTAEKNPTNRLEGLTLGSADYIQKPFDPDEFLIRVKYHLKMKLYEKGLLNSLIDRETFLSNIKQAIFTINEKGLIKSQLISKYSEVIFGKKLDGLNFYEQVFPNFPKGTEEHSSLSFALSTCFGSDIIQWELCQNRLPKKSTIHPKGETKSIEVNFSPIFKDGVIKELMLTIADITEKEKIEKDLAFRQKEENRRNMAIQELAPPTGLDIAHHSKDLKNLFRNTVDLIDEMEKAFKEKTISKNVLTQEKFEMIKRNIHTIKGNVRAYSLTGLSSFFHNIENQLEGMDGDPADWNKEKEITVFINIEKIKSEFDLYLKIGREVFSITTDKEIAPIEDHKVNIENLKKATSLYLKYPTEENLTALKKAEENLIRTPYKNHLKTFDKIVTELSKEVKKEVNFKSGGDEIFVDQEEFNLLNDSLIHLIRNSIDHGIEDRKTRMIQGKDSQGTLEITCRELEEGNTISIHDDGQGIDIDNIASLAVKNKITTIEKLSSMTDKEKLNLIFHPGLTSASDISEISGRGFGMNVVKTNMEKLKATIEIKTTLERGTEFLITLPSKKKP